MYCHVSVVYRAVSQTYRLASCTTYQFGKKVFASDHHITLTPALQCIAMYRQCIGYISTCILLSNYRIKIIPKYFSQNVLMKFASLYRYVFYKHYISLYHNPYWMRCILSVSAICRTCIGIHQAIWMENHSSYLSRYLCVSMYCLVSPCIGCVSDCIG